MRDFDVNGEEACLPKNGTRQTGLFAVQQFDLHAIALDPVGRVERCGQLHRLQLCDIANRAQRRRVAIPTAGRIARRSIARGAGFHHSNTPIRPM